MNVEQLCAIAKAYNDGLEASGLIARFGNLNRAFNALIEDNSETSQVAFNKQLTDMNALLDAAAPFDFPSTWAHELDEIGLNFTQGGGLAARINEAIENNRLTPVVARDDLAQLLVQISEKQQAFANVLTSFKAFDIEPPSLAPGDAELGMVIPSFEIDGNLQGFAYEVGAFDHSLSVISELVTGVVEPVKLKHLSSANPWIQVQAPPSVVLGYLNIIAEIQMIIGNANEISKVKEKAEAAGVLFGTISLIDKQAREQVADSLAELRDKLFRLYPGSTGKREDEFEALVDRVLREIASRIDKKFLYDGDIGLAPGTEAGAGDAAGSDGNVAAELKRVAQQIRGAVLPAMPILQLPGIQENRTRLPDPEGTPGADADAAADAGDAGDAGDADGMDDVGLSDAADGEIGAEEEAKPEARKALDSILKPSGFGKKGDAKK